MGKGKAMSNNVAEYAGVLRILKYLASRPPGRVTIHGDSNLVINQLNGKWRISKGLYLSIATETKELLAYLRGLGWQISLCWIPREQNEECDALSKKSCLVMDESAQQEGTDMPTSNPCRPESVGDHARLVAQRFRFARQDHCGAIPSIGLNFWMPRHSTARRRPAPSIVERSHPSR